MASAHSAHPSAAGHQRSRASGVALVTAMVLAARSSAPVPPPSPRRGSRPVWLPSVPVALRLGGGSGQASADPPEAQPCEAEGEGGVDPGLVPLEGPEAAGGLVGHLLPVAEPLYLGEARRDTLLGLGWCAGS